MEKFNEDKKYEYSLEKFKKEIGLLLKVGIIKGTTSKAWGKTIVDRDLIQAWYRDKEFWLKVIKYEDRRQEPTETITMDNRNS